MNHLVILKFECWEFHNNFQKMFQYPINLLFLILEELISDLNKIKRLSIFSPSLGGLVVTDVEKE